MIKKLTFLSKLDLEFFFPSDNARTLDKDSLLCEIDLLKILKPHPNVLGLLGCCVEKGKFTYYRISSLCIDLELYGLCCTLKNESSK